jgi:amino acid transporter
VNFGDSKHVLAEIFLLFVIFLVLHALVNIFTSHLVALFNSISVFWHVVGVAVVIAVLVLVPSDHQSFSFVFTHRINNSGFSGGMFWFYVLPLGFLLTQYTITGFDASAHISEETHGADESAPKGVWRSIFYSALIGYVLLLALTFAATKVGKINDGLGYGPGSSIAVLASAMSTAWVKLILVIAVVGQLFCGMSCLTSASRMCYAFSRDGAVPGWRLWSRVNQARIPFNAVILMAVAALVITLPALKGNSAGVPVAFTAVVSIAVIGLYIAYVIPIFLRLRRGAGFQPGPWNLGGKYKWMCTFSVIWVAIITVIFCLPFSPAGVPGDKNFSWNAVNYAPITVGVVLIAVGLWWVLSARNKFTGPRRTVDFAGDGPAVADPAPTG